MPRVLPWRRSPAKPGITMTATRSFSRISFAMRPAGRPAPFLGLPRAETCGPPGASFWTNLGDSLGAKFRIEHGWPRDAFFAKGTIGQYVIVIPSEHLVIARFGKTPNWPFDVDGVSRLVSDVVAATGGANRLAGRD